MANDDRPIVVKVGGSLFDMPELGKRLREWLSQFDKRRVLIVPGGGQAGDAVRLFDRLQQLGEEWAHWCALQAMELNAALLGSTQRHRCMVSDVAEFLQSQFHGNAVHILKAFAFAWADESNPDHFPHSWDVSSDSIAVRAATLMNAQKLIMLKSVTIPPGMTWTEASQRGYVDKYFPTALAKAGDLEVEAVNFRQWQPPP